jgi:hypothetical protein
VNEINVSSWHELHERLYEGSWNRSLRRFRSRFAFRGAGDAACDLSTSLARLGGPYHELERHILRDFRKYATGQPLPGDSMWTWLALAQHHGLPTRLLDWTFSPYVAMHFATAEIDCFDADGAIWCIDRAATVALLPDPLREIVADEATGVFTAEMLDRAAATLADFDALAPTPFVVFFEPPSLDERIVNQFALFSLLSDPRAHLDAWMDQHPDTAQRLVIPAALKWEVRDKLDQANVTERVLYPGLDGLARWLRRYYLPLEW